MVYVRMHLEEHVSIKEIEKRYGIANNQVSAWVRRYLEGGEEALEPKNGNSYAALHASKSLSEVERLRLIIAKQEVEIARLKKGIGWKELCRQGVRYWQRKDYEVIEELKAKYPVDFLCRIMGVNRSGYYKWRGRKEELNRYEKDRVKLTRLLRRIKKLPSYGYHRLAYEVFEQTGWIFSHNLTHKCCKVAEISQRPESALISGRAKRVSCFPTKSEAAGMPALRFRSLSPT